MTNNPNFKIKHEYVEGNDVDERIHHILTNPTKELICIIPDTRHHCTYTIFIKELNTDDQQRNRHIINQQLNTPTTPTVKTKPLQQLFFFWP